MSAGGDHRDEDEQRGDLDRERRAILRKVGLISWGLAAAAVLLAAVGGALLAWILTGAGMPFLRTWLLVSLLLIAVPLAIHVAPFPRRRPDGDGAGPSDGEDRPS